MQEAFVAAVLSGCARPDDFVERWHKTPTSCGLHEYLGLTLEEYREWVRGACGDIHNYRTTQKNVAC